MFHKATKLLAKELDPDGDLIPVRCLLDQNHFRPLCLVQHKCKTSFWQKCRYYKTDYKLCDILLPGEPASQPDIYDSDSFTFVDYVGGKLEGAATATTDQAALEIKSSSSMSHARSVKVKKRHVDAQVLDSLHKKRKINFNHPLIEQSEKIKRHLCVISETVETVEEAEFIDSSKTEGSILAKLHLKMKFTGRRDSKKAVIIPKACTLAFRVKILLAIPQPLAIPIEDIEWRKYGEMQEARKNKQLMKIEQECAPILSLSTDLSSKFLNGFFAIIRNNDLLEELELQLEQALDEINPVKLKTSRPELQELVDNLQDSIGAICPEIAESVLYFLQALDELSETELLLLEESVERKIVSKQTALVQCILEEDFSNKERKVTIETQKVSPFIKDELDITEAMIKECGMTVQRSSAGLVVTGSSDAFMALGALYVALYVLKILSE